MLPNKTKRTEAHTGTETFTRHFTQTKTTVFFLHCKGKAYEMVVEQGLSFHSTIVQREFTYLLMLFYLVVDQTATSTHVSGCYNIFFMFTVKKNILC